MATQMRNKINISEKNIRIMIIVAISLFAINCRGQVAHNNKTQDDNSMYMKTRANTISIENPITVSLEIEKNETGLMATLSFENRSDKNVMIDKNQMGGDNLKNHIFHVNPWYTTSNITFKPDTAASDKEENYMLIKPKETIKTQTNLSKYYDFNEQKYEIFTIIYLAKMKYLDEEFKQIVQRDIDGMVKPVEFSIESNGIQLNYSSIFNN
jgi:phage pi2 protein 07